MPGCSRLRIPLRAAARSPTRTRVAAARRRGSSSLPHRAPARGAARGAGRRASAGAAGSPDSARTRPTGARPRAGAVHLRALRGAAPPSRGDSARRWSARLPTRRDTRSPPPRRSPRPGRPFRARARRGSKRSVRWTTPRALRRCAARRAPPRSPRAAHAAPPRWRAAPSRFGHRPARGTARRPRDRPPRSRRVRR